MLKNQINELGLSNKTTFVTNGIEAVKSVDEILKYNLTSD